MSDSCTVTIETTGVAATRALGRRLGTILRGGETLALSGDLGAGKTAFTQGVAAGLGIMAAVTSPTFVLINRYTAPDGRVLQHADCYRLSHASAEMWGIGLADLMTGDDIVVVEWADRIPDLLPAEHLAVAFEYVDEERRRLCFTAHGAAYVALLQGLRQDH
jgi:tRNA threonylcarbamoyladenosine biosynthesis protein TsaE